MITENELLEAIAECQGQRNPDANTCKKLASYYIILEHMKSQEVPASTPNYSFASSPSVVGYSSSTDFGRIVEGKDFDQVLSVIDELMTILKSLNPRLYNGVMGRLE